MPEDPVLTRPNPVPSTTDVRRLGTAKLDALKPSKGPPTESEDDSGGSAPESTPEILRRSPTATPADAEHVTYEYKASLTTISLASAELVLKGEDKHTTRTLEVAGEALHFALVADGHGGKEAARLCKHSVIDAMLQLLQAEGVPHGKALRDAGRRAFLKAHAEI